MSSYNSGRIVEILDDKIYLVDKGYADGVKVNDLLMVYEEAEMFHGLDGGEINKINKTISYLLVVSVQEKLSTASLHNVDVNFYFCVNSTLGGELIMNNNEKYLPKTIKIGDLVMIATN
jgi:hypothetical protein